jgi:integrase
MKPTPQPTGTLPALQDVLDHLAGADLPDTRRRDLRSAVASYAKLVAKEPALIPLDLAELRRMLDRTVPAEAEVSAKRWANLRSDLAAAIDASGLLRMLKTSGLSLDPAWEKLLAGAPQRLRAGLSRFARWASLRQISPQAVDTDTLARFVGELELATLVRGLRDLERQVALSWNGLVRTRASDGFKELPVPSFKPASSRVSWEVLPASFHQALNEYLAWCRMPDPLDESARARALAARTVRLRREQIHSAVTAAVAADVPPESLISLAALVDADVMKALLRQLWKQDGGKLTSYTHGVAGTLIATAKEWVKMPADKLEILKALRRKLGPLPAGLTDKNEDLLRLFDDPRMVQSLLALPDRLWREARREPAGSGRAFLQFQNAIAIDVLIHTGLRMHNLSALTYDRHLHWTQGPGKPVLLVFGAEETKNGEKIELELPAVLGDRLQTFRNSIAPQVTGSKPDNVFVTWGGTPRGQHTLALAIKNTVRRRLGLQFSPHKFRHIDGKIYLDQNPGGYEVVRQLLGHKNVKTTIAFYAGINTKRAGRAHAQLLMRIREQSLAPTRHRKAKRKIEE